MTTPDSAKPEPTESGTLRESAFALLLVAAFAVVAVFGICHHEMWRDEIELLQVSLSSRSVGEYLHNIDICGHPRFYFLFVYALSRITGNPAVVPFAHLGIVLAAVFIWSMWAPFTRLQKTLFCFGYYPLFEYGVIARNYSIGLLVLFAFCACFCRKGRSYSGLGAVLACIALTNAHAIVIAVALVMALVLEALLDPETRASVGQKRRDAVTGLALACLGIALGFAQIKEPPGASLSWDFSFGARRAGCTLSIVFDSYVPVPDMTREHWWNTNCLGALRPEMLRQVARLIVSTAALMASVALLWGRLAPLLAYLAGTGALLLTFYAKFSGGVRHQGHIFVLFMVCLWLASRTRRSNWGPLNCPSFERFARRYGSGFLTGLLVANVAASACALGADAHRPFSCAKAAAEWISSHGWKSGTVVGSPDYEMAAILGYLGSPIYFVDAGRAARFTPRESRGTDDRDKLLEGLVRLLKEGRKSVLLVLNRPLEQGRSELAITEVARFEGSIVHDEHYIFYEVRPSAR